MGHLEDLAKKQGGSLEVEAVVPENVVADALKDKNIAEQLYESLSIKVKPENETPEQRKSRIMRRQLIANTFGLSVKELEGYLKDYVKIKSTSENEQPNEIDALRDSKGTLDAQDGSIKGNAINAVTSTAAAGAAVAGLINPALAPIGVIVTVVTAGITLYRTAKGKGNTLADKNEKSASYFEKLVPLMEKITVLNEIITNKIDAILENKNKLKPKAFAEYKKSVINELREEMAKHGVEIKVEYIDEQQKEEPKNETKQPESESEEQQTEPGE